LIASTVRFPNKNSQAREFEPIRGSQNCLGEAETGNVPVAHLPAERI
jgi:hypothetical protein